MTPTSRETMNAALDALTETIHRDNDVLVVGDHLGIAWGEGGTVVAVADNDRAVRRRAKAQR